MSVLDGHSVLIAARSIAIPMFDQAGETVAAMSISSRAERMTLSEMVQHFLPTLLTTRTWAQGRMD